MSAIDVASNSALLAVAERLEEQNNILSGSAMTLKGNSVYVRYSTGADGTDFTETWSDGQNYIGIAVGQDAPTDKSDYEWILFKGEKGDNAPYIGENGNWFINDEDTGVVANATITGAEIVQTVGDSETSAMSQKAVTKKFSHLSEEITDFENGITYTEKSNNIFDKNTMVTIGKWFPSGQAVGSKVAIGENQYTTTYGAVRIPIDDGVTEITVGTDTAFSSFIVFNYYLVDGNDMILYAATPQHYIKTSYTFDVSKATAKYLMATLQNYTNYVGLEDELRFNNGSELLPYDDYFRKKYIRVEALPSDLFVENKIKLNLPEEYALVVGDTFELFWKGVVFANNPYNYNIKVTCDIGSVYRRKYTVTPTAAHIGSYPMTIKLYDDNEKLLDEQTVNLVVRNKAITPVVQKNVLCVGDSLLVGGVWAIESKRRLTGGGGSPIADGLTNINYIGTCEKSGVKFEAYGGWTYESYNTANKTNRQQWITCTNDKTEADQHSIYKDANDFHWILETIESGRIKIVARYSTPYPQVLSSGTLTWVDGGTNHSDIAYTSAVQASGNPFWDDMTNKVDFSVYAERQGVSGIDYLYVLLGWNSTGVTLDSYTEQVKTFINNVHRYFPNCKINLMGLQVPSLDGCGENYGCAWNYHEKLKKVFSFNDLYKAIAEETDNVYFINIAGQFDTENNMPSTTKAVNVRNTNTETQQTNGVHPADSGYLQIADAVYRSITHRLQD